MASTLVRLLAALGATPLALACGTYHLDDQNAMALGGDLQGVQTELERHRDAVSTAGALDELPAELARHEHEMDARMELVSDRMDGMASHCVGSGMGRIQVSMGAMDVEMQAHRDDLLAATTLGEARALGASHFELMNDMLDDMRGDLDGVGCMMH